MEGEAEGEELRSQESGKITCVHTGIKNYNRLVLDRVLVKVKRVNEICVWHMVVAQSMQLVVFLVNICSGCWGDSLSCFQSRACGGL